MSKFYLITIAILILSNFVLFLFFVFQKNKAKSNLELYEETRKRNEELAAQVGKLQASEIIKNEERKNAEEKISNAYSGNASERFTAINRELQKRASN